MRNFNVTIRQGSSTTSISVSARSSIDALLSVASSVIEGKPSSITARLA